VDLAIFRRSPSVVEAVLKIDRDPSDPGDMLNAGKIVFAILQRPLGDHALGGLDHDGDHARRLSGFVENRGIGQIHPDPLRPAVPIERQLLIPVVQGAATQPYLHDMVVEVGNLGPSIAHFRSQQLWMSAAGKA
jgi:hypothetical protein